MPTPIQRPRRTTLEELPEVPEALLDYGDVLYHEEAFEAAPPTARPRETRDRPWVPKGGPIAMQFWQNHHSHTKFAYGERYSGKTNLCIHDLLIHCYEAFDPDHGLVPPLAIMATILRGSATTGGAWEKLITLNIPEWKEGIELDTTPPRQDEQKNRFMFVGNKARGWSRIVLKSMPYGDAISPRLRNIEASCFFFDEITETDDPSYYHIPLQSLRAPTGGRYQYICAGNPAPEGTSHWTWQLMVQQPSEKAGFDEPVLPHGGGRLVGPGEDDGAIAVYHVPLSENVHSSDSEKASYLVKLRMESVLDPSAEDRMIRGIWTPKASGNGLFNSYFVPSIHVRGDERKGLGLLPMRGFPIHVGYDLGQVNNSITLEQLVVDKKGRLKWIIFDEIDYLGERVLYSMMALELSARMRYWRKLVDYPFRFVHIADESAVNQWKPGRGGSYDAADFEKEFKKQWPEERMRLIGCPKGKGSVSARVRMAQAQLMQAEILVSALCSNTVNMFYHLEEEPKEPGHPKRSRWLHKFDSLTYPMFFLLTGGRGWVGKAQKETSLISTG